MARPPQQRRRGRARQREVRRRGQSSGSPPPPRVRSMLARRVAPPPRLRPQGVPQRSLSSRHARTDFRILLVRHGQSIANVDPTLFTTMADHAIPLSDAGKQQASECGKKIREYLQSLHRPPERLCRLWTSPYTRARETSRIIKEECGDIVHDVREGVLLGEQQFGLFEGVDWKELERFYPNEVAFYRKASSFGGRFWARMPLGESRFDVCQRVHQSFGAFHRDAERHGIQDLIIVSHGVTLRAFQMMWQDLSPEWFEAEPNPRNCSVRVLSGNNTDEGYIWGGPEVPEHDSQNLLLKAVAG